MSQTKELKRLNRILTLIKRHKEEMRALSDKELQHKTEEFKGRLLKGETLDDILPEAFAAICEADYRILGMFPYDAQILGGIAVHEGNLIEMNTGEGKTLMATMPLYLNALTGKSTLLLTTNEYLAIRDATEIGPVYTFMGLSVVAGVKAKTDERMSNDVKREIYSKDIVYNNFPWCNPTAEQKKKIEETAQAILDARALYPDCSLADLYDEVTMPPELRKAHQQNDKAVMQAYGFWGRLNTETECVAELMKMYQELTK